MPLLTYLAFLNGYQKRTFYNILVAITLSIEYIATIATVILLLAIYTAYLYKDHTHIIHVIHSIHVELCTIYLLTVTHETVLFAEYFYYIGLSHQFC